VVELRKHYTEMDHVGALPISELIAKGFKRVFKARELPDQSWREGANCEGMTPADTNRIFYPITYNHTWHRTPLDVYAEAKTYCGPCKVKAQCLSSAIDEELSEPFGFRGDRRPEERKAIYRRRKARRCQSHKQNQARKP